ncbi:amidohydrolase family protein [Caulobacter mirabilis]|uniref:amidohydrolase family protein n=1 Tax=Caulobacter mirabilis TaxID=69666 RepID=UPI0012372EF4|nr:amidohydrolase family protein [Caulobacter mirabilis]
MRLRHPLILAALIGAGAWLTGTAVRADGDYTVTIAGQTRGAMTVRSDGAGVREIAYSYVDRGRGPETRTRLRTGADGLPVELGVTGLGYFKTPVDERATSKDGAVTWTSAADEGTGNAGAYYLPYEFNAEISASLARALLAAPSRTLALLPGGRARIESGGERTVQTASGPATATLYLVDGLGFSASPIWLDAKGELLFEGGSWVAVARTDLAAEAAPALLSAQDAVLRERAVAAARSLGRRPAGSVAFQDVTLYDAVKGVFRSGMTVVVEGGRIRAVGPASSTPAPRDAERIDGRGRTLVPGLFDMHVHIAQDSDGLIDIASGVTSVRDLANDPDDLGRRKAAFDRGELVGPRIFMAGIIDGVGPLAGPTKALVDTPENARATVADWARRGYPQVKLYSSLKPELVPVLIEEAHRRGLRVSGHVPAGMTMEQAVRAGYDEVQHANFWMLNFMGPEVAAKTNSPVRFTAVGEKGAGLDLASPEVKAFVELLATRRIVVDPTMGAMEDVLTGRPRRIAPSLAAVADRLPSTVRRGAAAPGFAKTDAERARYGQSYGRLLEMLKLLHDRGVPVVAGTDSGAASLALFHELELYVQAGLTPAQALRTATLGAAQVAGAADRLGSIEVGKAADLLLVEGDPERDIGDLRKGVLVMKDGVIFEPDALYRAVGIAPSKR